MKVAMLRSLFFIFVVAWLVADLGGNEQPAPVAETSESPAEQQLLDDAEAIARKVFEMYGPDVEAKAAVAVLSLSRDEKQRVERSQFVSFEYSKSDRQRQVLLRCARRRGPRVAVNFDRGGKVLSRATDLEPASSIYASDTYQHSNDVLQRLGRFEPVAACGSAVPTRRAIVEKETLLAGRAVRLMQHWHCNGQEFSRLTFRSGARDGEVVAWHDNGIVWCKGRFVDDLPAGEWQQFDADGKLLQKIDFRDGKPQQRPTWSRTVLEYPGQLGARDFAFTIAQGNAPVGGGPPTVLCRTNATGRCEIRFGGGWKASFQLTETMQHDLRGLLRDIDFLALSNDYDNPSIHDGGWMRCTLRIGGNTKSIRCTNSYPRPLRDVVDFVNEEVLPQFAFEIAAAVKDETPLPATWKTSLLDDPPPE